MLSSGGLPCEEAGARDVGDEWLGVEAEDRGMGHTHGVSVQRQRVVSHQHTQCGFAIQTKQEASANPVHILSPLS